MQLQETQALLDNLLQADLLSQEQFRFVVEEQQKTGKPADVLLLERKIIDEEALAKAKGVILNFPYVDLTGKDIAAAVLNLIPRQVAENTRAIAFEKGDDNSVGVAMIDPRDQTSVQSIEFLAQTSNFRPRYFIMSAASITAAFKKYEAFGKEIGRALEAAKEKYVTEPEKEAAAVEETLEDIIKGAPVSRIVSVIIRHAVESNASDIHIEPFGDETRVRYRIDGVLKTTLSLPKYIHSSLISRVKVLSNLKLDETRIPQDGRISETINGKIIDFRVSTLPLTDSEKVVMRVLDTTRGVPTLEQLGFRPQYVEVIRQEIRKPHGMFLITGPTGSGKSTTLFTILNLRNEEGINISTLEDPVEYVVKGVNQAQVRPEVGFNFVAGLRALLRQDPNVIMVGEIRDNETGELAIHAALTGHLLFSTLHTNDAFGVVPRMVDMHLEPFLISATLNLAIAQRLARRICERCKGPVQVAADVEAKVREELERIPELYWKHLHVGKDKLTFFKGLGCLRCKDTGYVGRVAVAEVLVYGDEMRELVIQGFPLDKVRAAAAKQHMISLYQDGILKTLEGLTTLEEVYRITEE